MSDTEAHSSFAMFRAPAVAVCIDHDPANYRFHGSIRKIWRVVAATPGYARHDGVQKVKHMTRSCCVLPTVMPSVRVVKNGKNHTSVATTLLLLLTPEHQKFPYFSASSLYSFAYLGSKHEYFVHCGRREWDFGNEYPAVNSILLSEFSKWHLSTFSSSIRLLSPLSTFQPLLHHSLFPSPFPTFFSAIACILSLVVTSYRLLTTANSFHTLPFSVCSDTQHSRTSDLRATWQTNN